MAASRVAPVASSGAPPAVVLLSGGLDSATCLAMAIEDGFSPVALSFLYGQRQAIEVEAARAIAVAAGVDHVVSRLDLGGYGGSALTDDIAVPKHDDVDEVGRDGVPVTYVPARNTVFLAHALALAEVRGADVVYLGVNAVDYSGYPDCRPAFVDAFEALANVATRAATEEGRRFEVRAPLLALGKGDIVRRALALGVDVGATRSCYDPDAAGRACSRCDACLLRAQGFAEAGAVDPAPSVARRS